MTAIKLWCTGEIVSSTGKQSSACSTTHIPLHGGELIGIGALDPHGRSALGLQLVLRSQRPNSLDGAHDECDVLLGSFIGPRGNRGGVRGNHDRLGGVSRSAGKALPELLGDIRHVRMNETQRRFEARVQRVANRVLGLVRRRRCHHRLGALDKDVAKLVQPERVARRGALRQSSIVQSQSCSVLVLHATECTTQLPLATHESTKHTLENW
jgi:hypothetical protein